MNLIDLISTAANGNEWESTQLVSTNECSVLFLPLQKAKNGTDNRSIQINSILKYFEK